MRWMLAALLALLVAPAWAGTYQDQHGLWWMLIDPPARFANAAPLSPPVVNVWPEEEVKAVCGTLVLKAEPTGCSLLAAKDCKVYVAADLPEKFRTAVLRHELAHCAGWPADHPTD